MDHRTEKHHQKLLPAQCDQHSGRARAQPERAELNDEQRQRLALRRAETAHHRGGVEVTT